MLKPLRHRAEILSLRPLELWFRFLPFGLSLRLASWLGLIAYYLIPLRKKVVKENLRRALGPKYSPQQLNHIARQCYQHAAISIAEFIQLRHRNWEDLQAQIEKIQGLQYLKQVGDKERPFIVISGHIGNWEFMGAYFSGYGLKLTVVAKPIHNPFINDYVNQVRHAKGYEVVYAGEGMKTLITRIKEKRVVVFLPDQDARKEGIIVDFFGQPAATFTGPAVFMLKMGLPILPVFDIRVGLDKHRIIFYPPIYPPQGLEKEEAIRQAINQYTGILEEVICRYPGQYFWFHRRWKSTLTRNRKNKSP